MMMTNTGNPAGTTLQLRTYQLDPALADEFVAWWAATMPALRQRFGFRIAFAYLDEDNALFAWGLEFDGDRDAFLAAEKAYNDSPERKGMKLPNPAMVRSVSAGFARTLRRFTTPRR